MLSSYGGAESARSRTWLEHRWSRIRQVTDLARAQVEQNPPGHGPGSSTGGAESARSRTWLEHRWNRIRQVTDLARAQVEQNPPGHGPGSSTGGTESARSRTRLEHRWSRIRARSRTRRTRGEERTRVQAFCFCPDGGTILSHFEASGVTLASERLRLRDLALLSIRQGEFYGIGKTTAVRHVHAQRA
jgi:hypothetical protein